VVVTIVIIVAAAVIIVISWTHLLLRFSWVELAASSVSSPTSSLWS
jgi:hypothetical protein